METFKITGKIRGELNIEWIIKDFLQEDDELYESPTFAFAGHIWCLRVYPNGRKSKNSDEYISLYLMRISFGPAIKIDYTFGLKTLDGEIDPQKHCTDVFTKARMSYGLLKFLQISELLDRETELLPFKALVVVCSLKIKNSDEGLTNSNEILLNDFKSLMMSGDHSDVTFIVKGEEFKLHRNVLGCRNCVFDAMFKVQMIESATGIVSIDDCEPHVFRSFIHFLYTGKVDILSAENVCDLYQVADKYQENTLKNICLYFMKDSMSASNFCDFMAFAIQHDEKQLLQIASEFFSFETKEIRQSPKWQIFLKEYPTHASQLHIKARIVLG